MSGFDLSRMMPLYLDETEELIAAMNDALLRLEQEPDDPKALQEAFRYVHTIKGSSALLGLEPVKDLTHELETIFDQSRSKKRTLDPPAIELFFRCLDALRDYHQDLRSEGVGRVDLAGLTAQVVEHLSRSTSVSEPSSPKPQEQPKRTAVPSPPTASSETSPPPPSTAERIGLRVTFEPGLQLPDMKARLVLNRLASRVRVLESDPPGDRIDGVEDLRGIVVWLAAGDASIEALWELADVDGVSAIEIVEPGSVVEKTPPEPSAKPSPIDPEPSPKSEPLASISAAPAPSPPPDLSPSSPTREEPPSAPPVAEPEPRKPRGGETVRVDIDRLDGLMNLAGELVINKARFLQVTSGLEELFRASSARFITAETQDQLDSLDRLLGGFSGKVGGDAGAIERQQALLRSLRENFRAIRGELDLIRQGRERLSALSEAINQLARVADGIQKGVLNTRMVPIGPLFARFRRVVRDLSVSSGKEVSLRISGEKTELDKRMIDELGDPLIHMVRNSVDHGLESPEVREKVGKPRVGTVSLSASHRGNSVVITVADDGKGIDVERIRRKAVTCGIASEDEARRLSDRELINLIWHPGLSTAEKITDISGRGVGMDIVKARIEALNGSVDVRTVPGQGTTFLIRLPLTLAIMPSLLVRIYEEVYAIPLDHVEEIVEAPPASVHRIHRQRTLEIRRKVIGLVSLGDVFRWAGGPHPSVLGDDARATPDKLTVVVLHDGDMTLGLIVDELIGIQEVVLKSLERNFRSVRGLSGASILGDGRVSLILDADAVIGSAGRAAEPIRA